MTSPKQDLSQDLDGGNNSDDGSKYSNEQNNRSQLDEAETLLTNSFDDQLRLVGNSINGKKNCNDLEIEKQVQNRKNKKKKKASAEQQQTERSRSRLDKGDKPVLSHQSKLFRFDSSIDKGQVPIADKSNCDDPLDVTASNRSAAYDRISIDGPNQECPLVPPPPTNLSSMPEDGSQAHASMMMSWYMAGYHTGYYAAMRKFKLCE